MQDVEREMKRINSDVAKLREVYGIEQMTLEQRAERWRKKQALIAEQIAAVSRMPKWMIK